MEPCVLAQVDIKEIRKVALKPEEVKFRLRRSTRSGVSVLTLNWRCI